MNLANIFLPKGSSLEVNGVEVVLMSDAVVQTNPYTVGLLYNPVPAPAYEAAPAPAAPPISVP